MGELMLSFVDDENKKNYWCCIVYAIDLPIEFSSMDFALHDNINICRYLHVRANS
jgi:hypothetical protein